MSELFEIHNINFEGKKPSKAQIMVKINAAIQSGAAAISVNWGENWLQLDYHRGQWIGQGWIKALGGDDIAQELNRAEARALNKTLNLWNS
jgi:hypothetical protein